MGIYSKEVFGGVSTTIVDNHGTSTPLSTAVVETMIEGYVAFNAANDTFTSSEQAKQFVSDITKTLVDNGDLTDQNIETIKTWVDRHYKMFSDKALPINNNKLFSKIVATCNPADCPEIAEVQKLQAKLNAAKAKVLAKYGPSISQEVMTFVQRYGKTFDQTYIKEWTDICGVADK